MTRSTLSRLVGWTLISLSTLALACSGGPQEKAKTGAGDDQDRSAPEAHSEAGASEHGGEHGKAGEARGEGSEDRVEISAATRAASGVEVAVAESKPLRVTLDLPGEVVPNADRVAHIVPRFPGIARKVFKRVGESVREGELLAVIEGNQSLSTYEVTSLISGTVIEKHVTLGEFVRDDADIYMVADLSSVWVSISVYARDLGRVRRGQSASIESVGSQLSAEGTIDYVGPVVGEETRAATARVVLSNPGAQWRPGTFVTTKVTVDRRAVKVAVPDQAIQQLKGADHVFVESEGGFVARPVRKGATDGEWTEILDGLRAGERYAARGGFILKSELQKSEAGHEH